MELPGLPPLKRPIELPTPETLAAIFNNPKRQKLSSVLQDINRDYTNGKAVNSIGKLSQPPNLPLPFTNQQFEAPLLNSVPSNIIPIIHPPATITDYFTDVKTDLTNKKLSNQIIGIIQKFPPPLPPFPPPQSLNDDEIDDEERGGIMVPFIYPPPPIINPDTLPYSLASFKQRFDQKKATTTVPQEQPVTRGRKPTKKLQEQQERQREQQQQQQDNVDEGEFQGKYIQAPPLPFPPPNYMSYPISANKSTLLPSDVFQALITASEELPRTDMVVASAAGSLYDMRNQAEEEGFNIEEFESNRVFNPLEDEFDNEENDGSESDDEDTGDYNEDGEQFEYMRKIDTTDYLDPFEKENKNNVFQINLSLPEYTKVSQKLSKLKDVNYKEKKSKKLENEFEFADNRTRQFLEDLSPSDIIDNPGKDISLQSGSNRERRRIELVKTMNSMEQFSQNNRDEIYRMKKNKLLTRLHNLRNSKITFTNIDTNDEELDKYRQLAETERDEQLVQLKLRENYELLKASLVFYEDSNKAYKNLNSVLVNKLEKLKNFFEYQRDLFMDYLDRKQDIFDIKSKESQKLFNGISNRNYSQEIKNIIKNSIINEQKLNLTPLEMPDHDLKTLPKDTSNVFVHDFMPLVTPEEFNIITGDIPRKSKLSNNAKDNKPANNMKHQIFQNSLYERMTSGSDTNASDASNISSGPASGSGSTTTGPKRRGRRSAQTLQQTGSNTANTTGNNNKNNETTRDGLTVKYSEATLMAKIMKQFIGPQSALPDELNNDLEMMGIQTRWPVSK